MRSSLGCGAAELFTNSGVNSAGTVVTFTHQAADQHAKLGTALAVNQVAFFRTLVCCLVPCPDNRSPLHTALRLNGSVNSVFGAAHDAGF